MDNATYRDQSESLYAYRVRVRALASFQVRDYQTQESQLGLMNGALSLAEETATLALKEVEEAAKAGVAPRPVSTWSSGEPPQLAVCRAELLPLVERLWHESDLGKRAALALQLAELTTTLAKLESQVYQQQASQPAA